MIPKSSRFKCCHCGWLKRKPGKCVVCRKVANFDKVSHAPDKP
jgi:predicted ATP-dependent serine protease